MDTIPAEAVDWTGWVWAGVTWGGLFWAFITGRIVPRSVVDDWKESDKINKATAEKNSDAIDKLLEIGHTEIELLNAIRSAGGKKR